MKTVSSSADCKATPEVACSRILSEQGMHAWWIGKVKVVDYDAAWPALNTRMSWRAGGGLFVATICEDSRPKKVVMSAVTPAADSKITHSFDSIAGGGTRYSKTVEVRARTRMFRLIIPLFMLMIGTLVKKEVRRAAVFADGDNQKETAPHSLK